MLICYLQLQSMEHDIPPGGGTTVPLGDNQVTSGNPVASKVRFYFQAPGVLMHEILSLVRER